jgi:predicted dienelactone hydrolase
MTVVMPLLLATTAPDAEAQGGSVGFQRLSVADAADKPLELGIWYPTEASATPQRLELYSQTVAPDAPIGRGASRLPLVVISHGTGGSLGGHHDTALALASAGFIAAAVTHTGDNFRDQSYAGTPRQMTERPRHVSRVVDFLIGEWAGRDRLDAARIGIFGFSAGGFTALVSLGAKPDLARIGPHCREHPEDWVCQFVRGRPESAASGAPATTPPPAWIHDARLKAGVVAAPAVGFTFAGDALKGVNAPIQLWRAAEDRILPHPWHAEVVRTGLPNPPDYRVVPNAGHFAFLAPCSPALAAQVPPICTDAPGFDRMAFHAEFNNAAIAFFSERLGRP